MTQFHDARSGTSRRRSRWGLLAVVVGALFAVLAPAVASAHEFGPFAIDRYAALRVAPDEIELDYVLGLAETPTQADGDSIEAAPEEYCSSLAEEMTFTIDGDVVALDGLTATVAREDGDGGLTTLRVVCNWVTPVPTASDTHTIELVDDNYSGRVGWREIIVVGDRAAITGDVSDESVTERLTDFPDADENPDLAQVEFEFTASDEVDEATLPTTEPGDDDGGGDAFSDLIASADGGIGAMLIALGFAAFLGALHSLAPGHGKTVIGAYLVGTRGTKVQAFVLAVAVALSHTLGVLILGIITYAAGAAFAPERVYPWLQGLSAVIVLGIGIWLVVTAVREWRARDRLAVEARERQELELAQAAALVDAPLLTRVGVAAVTGSAIDPHLTGGHGHGDLAVHRDDHDHDHDHAHANGHDHDHDHDHAHANGRDHDHDHDHAHANGHDHDHDHDHAHANGHDHDHANDHALAHASANGHTHAGGHAHADGHDHSHDHDSHDHDHDHGSGWHRHGIFPHTHKFDMDELDLSGKVSWKTLAALGLSGGLVPSTSAIIVLLGAIQLNRIAFGGLLILAFGLGMAIALVSVGLGMVALRDKTFGAMDQNSMIQTARIWVVPIAAFAVMGIGLFLVVRAVIEINGL